MTSVQSGPSGEARPDPNAMRGGWREFGLVLVGSITSTVLMTYPLAFQASRLGRSDSFDYQFSVWNVAWVARTLVVDPLHVFDANIFYPHRWTLAYSEANFGAGILAIPAYWATRNPYVANNSATLLSFVLSGLGMYYLVRYLSQDRRAAAISALCFSFCPYVFAHIAHIQLLMTAGLPFSMLAFHRLVDRPSAGRSVWLGVAMAAAAASCGYYGVFLMLMIGAAVFLVAATRGLWTDLRYWRAVALAAVVAIAVVLPMFVPYIILQREPGFARSLSAALEFSADWRAYFASSAPAHSWMLKLLGHCKEVAFPGFVATAFGITGVLRGWFAGGRSRELAWLYGAFAVLACWASFGPGAGLYSALYYAVPGFTLLRAASRFCVVVVFSLSVLTGHALAGTLRRVRRPTLVSLILGIVVIGELHLTYPYRPVPPLEPAYRVLATLPRGPVLELPVYSPKFAFQRSRYMLASTWHWMPLVDAYSDYIPEDFTQNLGILADFPSREALALLKRDQVRYAVFHMESYKGEGRQRLELRLEEFAETVQRRYADDQIWLYEITLAKF